MPYLVHKDKDGSVIQFWNLHEGVMTVGRAPEVNAQVDDPKLSRKHFEITPAAGQFTLKDLGAANGTFVNGNRVTEKVLAANDNVRAGDSSFFFMDGLTTMAAKLDDDIKNLGKYSLDTGEPPSQP